MTDATIHTGDWDQAQGGNFADGGIFDEIDKYPGDTQRKRPRLPMRTTTITEMASWHTVAQDGGAVRLRPVSRKQRNGAISAPKRSPRNVADKPVRSDGLWKNILLFPLALASGIYDLFSGMSLSRKVAVFIVLVLAVAVASVAALPWLLMRAFLPAPQDDDSY